MQTTIIYIMIKVTVHVLKNFIRTCFPIESTRTFIGISESNKLSD